MCFDGLSTNGSFRSSLKYPEQCGHARESLVVKQVENYRRHRITGTPFDDEGIPTADLGERGSG